MADANESGREEFNFSSVSDKPGIRDRGNDARYVHNTDSSGCERQHGRQYGQEPAIRHQWDAEPSVGRVAHGIPHRVDRIRAIGNAIVPQVIYQIFEAIAMVEKGRK